MIFRKSKNVFGTKGAQKSTCDYVIPNGDCIEQYVEHMNSWIF